jgi:hypothetical protein
VGQLFGISEERQDSARELIASWRIPHLEPALAPDDADGAVAAVLLAEAVELLVEQGTEESKLLAKLRRDPDVWPTWAELRAAGLIARETTAGDSHLLLEPDRSSGRHADFAFAPTEDEPRHSIEFKAIGLSDAEAGFSDRIAPVLPGLPPRHGVLTMHLEDTDTNVVMNRDEPRRHRREAERRARYLPPQVQLMAAATAVGHGTEQSYIRRLSWRAVGQLSESRALTSPSGSGASGRNIVLGVHQRDLERELERVRDIVRSCRLRAQERL